MIRCNLLALALAFALIAAPTLAQEANPRVALETAKGRIVVELFVEKAPVTVKNFLRYVDAKRFDGATFYRASTAPGGPRDYGLLQGGLQNDPGRVFPPIAHEPTTETGLTHASGTISMGRHAPGTAQADWFIVVGDQTYLDADGKSPGFAAFGRAVEGMDLVKALLAAPVDPDKGEGAMRGEMLRDPVEITTARRLP